MVDTIREHGKLPAVRCQFAWFWNRLCIRQRDRDPSRHCIVNVLVCLLNRPESVDRRTTGSIRPIRWRVGAGVARGSPHLPAKSCKTYRRLRHHQL